MSIKIGEKKILRSPLEPKDKNWLWLKTVAGFPVLYEYLSGKWVPFSDATAEYMETHILSRVFGSTKYDKDNHCIEFYAADGSDMPIGVIDTSEFEVSIDADDYYTKAEVEEYVSEYVSEHGGSSADLSNYYTKSEVDSALEAKAYINGDDSEYFNVSSIQFWQNKNVGGVLTQYANVNHSEEATELYFTDNYNYGSSLMYRFPALGIVTEHIATQEYVAAYVSEHGGSSADLSDYYTSSEVDTLLSGKVSVVSGKGLSTNDYTTAEKTKLEGIAAGAEVNVQPNWTQTNTSADDYIKNKPTLATVATSGSYDDLSNKPTIPAAQVQSDWNATSGMGVILNKPTIPDTSTLATKTELNGKQDTINDLASIRINSGKGVTDVSSNADGTVVTTLANGDTYTLDLNHEHPQYVESTDLATVATTGDYDDLTDKPTIPTKVSDLQNDSGFTTNTGTLTGVTFNGTTASVSSGVAAITATIPADLGDLTNNAGYTKNTGTITGITMNNVSKGTSGVVDLGTVITAHQDISGKVNKSEMAVSTSGDQTTITLKTGTSATVINQHQSLSGYAKYVLLSDDAAYEALVTKDSGTLYLIPEA